MNKTKKMYFSDESQTLCVDDYEVDEDEEFEFFDDISAIY